MHTIIEQDIAIIVGLVTIVVALVSAIIGIVKVKLTVDRIPKQLRETHNVTMDNQAHLCSLSTKVDSLTEAVGNHAKSCDHDRGDLNKLVAQHSVRIGSLETTVSQHMDDHKGRGKK